MSEQNVTLGAGLLERAAHLRASSDEVKRGAQGAPGAKAQFLLLWRGRVPIAKGESLALCSEEMLPHSSEPEADLFLGLMPDGVPIFARDISARPSAEQDAAPSTPWQTDGIACAGLEGLLFFDLRAVMTELSPLEAEIASTARALFEWHRSHRFCACCGAASELAEAGWRRDCPACDTSHFPRTDPVVIMLVTHGNSVLLGRSPGWPDRMYSLLAGFVEPGEPIEAAVRREVFEEAGIQVGDVRYIASQPWPFPTSLMFGCEAEALSTDIRLDPNELEDAVWLRREDLALAMAGAHSDIAAPRKGAIAHFLLTKWLADIRE